jgi:flagellar biosynthesis protein FlhG
MSDFMKDQAESLRRIMAVPKPRIISIFSAAGPQDKSRTLPNLAASLNRHGKDVLVVHAAENSSEMLENYGIAINSTLLDGVQRGQPLENEIRVSAQGFSVARLMPQLHMGRLDGMLTMALNEVMTELAGRHDIVLVDAALTDEGVLPLACLNEGEIFIQLSNDPESIKSAYFLIKQVCSKLGRRGFGILVTGVSEPKAQDIYQNMAQVARRFLGVELEFIGSIPADEDLYRAAQLGRAVIEAFPLAKASGAFKQLAQRLGYSQPNLSRVQSSSFS